MSIIIFFFRFCFQFVEMYHIFNCSIFSPGNIGVSLQNKSGKKSKIKIWNANVNFFSEIDFSVISSARLEIYFWIQFGCKILQSNSFHCSSIHIKFMRLNWSFRVVFDLVIHCLFRFISLHFSFRFIFQIKCKTCTAQLCGKLFKRLSFEWSNSHKFSSIRIKLNDLQIASSARWSVSVYVHVWVERVRCVCFCSLHESLQHRRKTLILFRE